MPGLPTGTTFEATFSGTGSGESYTGAQVSQPYVKATDWDDYSISGNGGDDRLRGSHGDDRVNGGVGNDIVWGTHGQDSYDGGDGYDTLDFTFWGRNTAGKGAGGINVSFRTEVINTEDPANVTTAHKFTGFERLFGSGYDDVFFGNDSGLSLRGGGGNDTISSGGGADSINGEAGNDTINGGLGDDSLWGGDGNDWIVAGVGADTITGGVGGDRLQGGGGADKYVYTRGGDSGVTRATRDFIDFKQAEGDKIILELVDANTNASGDQDFTFIGNSAFSNVAGQLRYFNATSANGAYTIIEADRNGNGVADFAIGIDGTRALVLADFDL